MSTKIELTAVQRDISGKKVKQLRRSGNVPATMYEKGKESINISIDYNQFVKVWSVAGSAQPVELVVDGAHHLTMIKDVHIDPAKHTVMHAAFHAVNKNDPVEAEIPVVIEGDIPAELQGNFIVRPHTTVLVKALPGDLPEAIHIAAAPLQQPGDSLTVADITPIDNVAILADASTPLAIVEEPRKVEEVVAEDTDAAEVPSEHGGATEEESTTKTQ